MNCGACDLGLEHDHDVPALAMPWTGEDMEITSGSEWGVMNSANRRMWSITLDENDGAELADDWPDMSWKKRRAFLSMRGDLEVLVFMAQEGAITPEYAASRAQELKAKYEKVQ